MAVELMPGSMKNTFSSKIEKTAVQEAATAGLQSVEKLIRLISQSQQNFQDPLTKVNSHQTETSTQYVAVADAAVDKFKKFISLLDRPRTGHARFRKAPISHPVQDSTTSTTSGSKVFRPVPVQRLPPLPRKDAFRTIIFTAAGSAAPAEEAVSGGDSERSMLSGFQFTNLSQTSSAGKPPLSTSSFKRKCSSMEDSGGKCGGSSSSRCHCPNKCRKSKVKKVVRIPAISSKMADIPPDDFSWRKYGQKPIRGSPYPRGYYKCSSVKGCPALKHVEKALDDPNMLVVTYIAEHNHRFIITDTPASLVLESS